MKRILLVSVIIFITVIFNSCVDEQVVVDDKVIPEGRIIIDSNPRNAKILFLGSESGKRTPDSLLNIESGTYDITLILEGYRDTTFYITVLNKYRSTKFIKLLPIKSSGTISLKSEPPGAQIFLSGANTGKVTPDSLSDLDPGEYSLTLKLSGYKDTTFNTLVTNGNTTSINVSLKDTLPVPDGNITFRSVQFNQVLFTFTFNQGIYIDRIEARAPLSDTSSVNDFQNELVNVGEDVVLIFDYFPGTWTFTIYGRKAGGDTDEFVISKQVFVL